MRVDLCNDRAAQPAGSHHTHPPRPIPVPSPTSERSLAISFVSRLQASIVREKMDIVKDYVQWRRMPPELATRIKAYYLYYYSNSVRAVCDEPLILNGLSPALRREALASVLRETCGRCAGSVEAHQGSSEGGRPSPRLCGRALFGALLRNAAT